jgi:hypothetical protein
MKTGPDALGITENVLAQNMKTGLDVLCTVENNSRSGKYEN